MTLQLTSGEKEVVILKAVWDMINEAVNYSILQLHHDDPHSELRFISSQHQKYFNIVLVDFLSKPDKILDIDRSYLDGLQDVCENPHFAASRIVSLRNAVSSLQHWLQEFVNYGSGEDARQLWFPSLETEVQLQIRRIQFIRICGNISKHNFSRLGRQACDIIKIFQRSKITLSKPEALLVIDEFFEQFHDDLLVYHSSSIAEFLNNIRMGIYEYLLPEFHSSVVYSYDKGLGVNMPKYTFPNFVKVSFVKEIYWDLMNMVRSGPWMPRFEVSSYLKGRY